MAKKVKNDFTKIEQDFRNGSIVPLEKLDKYADKCIKSDQEEEYRKKLKKGRA